MAALPWYRPLATWRRGTVSVELLAGGAVRIGGAGGVVQVGAPAASAGAPGSERLAGLVLPTERVAGMAGLLGVLAAQEGDRLHLLHPLPGQRVAGLAAVWAEAWPSGVPLTVDSLGGEVEARVGPGVARFVSLVGVEVVGGQAAPVATHAVVLLVEGVTVAVVPEGGGRGAAGRAVAGADLAVLFSGGAGPDARSAHEAAGAEADPPH